MRRRLRKRFIPILCLPFVAAGVLIFNSLKPKETKVIIWTDQNCFASYAELFNTTQNDYQVIIKYKENLAEDFPADSGGQPDIVIGPWLKNEKVRKNFMPLDFLFKKEKLLAKDFYPQLLDLGNMQDKQYLLPVSFNLPVIIFSDENEKLIEDSFVLSISQIRDLASAFNKRNKKNVYTAMGFSPAWNADFMYVVSKLFGANYTEAEPLFSFNKENIEKSIAYLKEWSYEVNTNPEAEDEFQFKYLYEPAYKLVNSGKCLFSYTKTDYLFKLPTDRLQNLNFRWIEQDQKIAVSDKLIYMGVYRGTKNKAGAAAFITWFLNGKTQESLLERSASQNLTMPTFGISDGFSSLRAVNEKYLTKFYPQLYGHVPTAELLSVPNILPARWEDIKQQVIIPYLKEASRKKDGDAEPKDLEARMKDWLKQNY
ncbi:MAG: carbohydrate ABC transporter substrate-binding protein [Spirochaetaceae bacterium]|nr:carbohydrate ABC transporter substrate-binding protein [Spirochaetaceae bacterium]MBO4728523.1 carbohydrate ABC transporter substrate-binding protein [Spirochaetaceae bacterium]